MFYKRLHCITIIIVYTERILSVICFESYVYKVLCAELSFQKKLNIHKACKSFANKKG